MEKRNLAILLVMPFVISLIGMRLIDNTFTERNPTLKSIEWSYQENNAFYYDEGKDRKDNRYQLVATAVSQNNYPVKSNFLIWSVSNDDEALEPHAKIETENGLTYLVPLSDGEIRVTVTAEAGGASKSFKGFIYSERQIVLNQQSVQASMNNIDPTTYIGEYDLTADKKNKKKSKVDFNIKVYPAYEAEQLELKEVTPNLKANRDLTSFEILDAGEASITYGFKGSDLNKVTVKLNIVDEGVNVYSYDDLLACTNYSDEGEVVVLRTNLESVSGKYYLTESGDIAAERPGNISLFGHYNQLNRKFSFNEEAYRFKTTFNHSFIDQWNEQLSNIYGELTTDIVAGIHVQKSFYGNGYTINLHNLTYPYSSQTRDGLVIPSLTSDNLFRGPLPFYSLGNPNNILIVGAYGQDNIGMYVDGDDIIINDINLIGADWGNNLNNLQYVGTVMETLGNNITVKNSRLSAGKNIFRSFSSDVTLDNCLLQYSLNFLVETGSYKYEKVNPDLGNVVSLQDGGVTRGKISSLFSKDSEVDLDLGRYLVGKNGNNGAKFINDVQEALDTTASILVEEDGNLKINNCLFAEAGITPIACESLFNGPFLYNASPSYIRNYYEDASSGGTVKSLIPILATDVGGISYPYSLTLSGNCKFFDYKKQSDDSDHATFEFSGLIAENISSTLKDLGYEKELSIDDFFPLKSLLFSKARSERTTYQNRLNCPIVYYGGGENNAHVHYEGDIAYYIYKTLEVDFAKDYLSLPAYELDLNNPSGAMNFLKRCVPLVTGFKPFKFVTIKPEGVWYNEKPSFDELIKNAKGAN